jgi:proline iminopeptidase
MWSTDFVNRSRADDILEAAPLYRCPRNDTVFRSLAADQRRILDAEFAASLRALDAPVLALHGDGDAGIARSQEVVDLVPHGHMVVLPEAGHSPWFEAPAEFAGSICGFLAAL